MNKFHSGSLNRFVSVGFAALVAAVLLVPVVANATPYVLTITQQGSNVVGTGSGAFDLTGLTLTQDPAAYLAYPAWVSPSTSQLELGSLTAPFDVYSASYSGPASFGSGGMSPGSTGSGDPIAIGASLIYLPTGYISGTSLSDNGIWDNASFASLGVTPGKYVWTWGTGAQQSFTLDIREGGNGVNVPEPAALGLFGFGVLLSGAFVGLRRRIS